MDSTPARVYMEPRKGITSAAITGESSAPPVMERHATSLHHDDAVWNSRKTYDVCSGITIGSNSGFILETALSLSVSSVPASLVVVAVVLSFTSRRRRLCRARICPFYLSGLQLTSFSLARLTLPLYNKDLI